MKKGRTPKEHQKLLIVLISLIITSLFLIAIIILINADRNSSLILNAEYYQNLASDIMYGDTERSRGTEVIDYAIRADNIDQSIDSATFVLNAASAYYMEDIHNQYLEVLRERQISDGVNLNIEGAG